MAVEAPAGVVHLGRRGRRGYHTCAHGSDEPGSIYCWGDNDDGQLGDGTDRLRAWTPVAVQAPAGVVLSGVSGGGAHTCAHGSDGKVYGRG